MININDLGFFLLLNIKIITNSQYIPMTSEKYLFLLDFQVILEFQGIQIFQVVRALLGIQAHQEGREDLEAQECCCDIRRESGWAAHQFCSSGLQNSDGFHQVELVKDY